MVNDSRGLTRRWERGMISHGPFGLLRRSRILRAQCSLFNFFKIRWRFRLEGAKMEMATGQPRRGGSLRKSIRRGESLEFGGGGVGCGGYKMGGGCPECLGVNEERSGCSQAEWCRFGECREKKQVVNLG